MSAPTLEGSSKVPIGLSPVTGERYFPVTFNCMKELHNITQTAEKSNFIFSSEDESAKVDIFLSDGQFCIFSQNRYYIST